MARSTCSRYISRICTCVALLAALLATPHAARSAEPAAEAPNVGGMIVELMRMHLQGDQTVMVIWLPYEFFVASSQASGETREAAEANLNMLKPYHILFVARQVETADGGSEYASEDAIKASSTLIGPKGDEVKPVQQVPKRVSMVVGAMRQAMMDQGGEINKNLRLLVFPATVGDKPLVDIDERTNLKLDLKESGKHKPHVVTWNLPLDAMHKAAPCAKCKGETSAKWTFCPWCSAKLPELKPGK